MGKTSPVFGWDRVLRLSKPLAANWFMGLASLSALLMLLVRLPKEEAKLIERFGDEYREYMRRTGSFFPRLKGSS